MCGGFTTQSPFTHENPSYPGLVVRQTAMEPVALQYDPHKHLSPEAWQALDESERIELVRQYHERNRIRLPNETLHAATHVIVENQVALGDAFPVRAVLFRLMEEGLDRHDAVHAIGSVLAEQLFAGLDEEGGSGTLNADYLEKLKHLTADSWRKQAP